MLNGLLNGDDCQACKWCCSFDETDIHEKPQIFEETACYIKEHFQDIKLVEEDGVFFFDMPKVYMPKEQKTYYVCPMLEDGIGCRLGEERMADCWFWPFRIMETPGGLAITLAESCSVVSQKSDYELNKKLFEGEIAELIFRLAERRPVMVKPYEEGYRILLYKGDYINGKREIRSAGILPADN